MPPSRKKSAPALTDAIGPRRSRAVASVPGTKNLARPQSDGQIELVFGMVGPTGVDLTRVCSVLEEQLKSVGYEPHVVRLSELIFGLMTSLFSAAFQISQNERNNGTNGYQQPTASQTAGAAVAQQMSQLGIEIARKNLRVQPTIEIRPGYQFNVRVDKDLLFSRPYSYGNAR